VSTRIVTARMLADRHPTILMETPIATPQNVQDLKILQTQYLGSKSPF
jgi:hypothetical protein